MRPGIFAPLLLLSLHPAPGNAQAPTGPPLSARITETLMGPRTQRITVSEDGGHLAIVAPKGSRQVVLIDGVEGPLFDEIPLNFSWNTFQGAAGSVIFSPTGGHSAYVGRRAGDFMAVVDGKEAVTLSTPATIQGNYGNPSGWRFFFNQDGTHLAYGAMGGPGSWVMVLDGVKSPSYRSIDFQQTALNGNHLAYVAQTADQKWHTIVDGKPGPAYDVISSLKLTPDGAHAAYIATRQGSGLLHMMAVVDGVESKLYQSVSDLEQAQDGRIAYLAAMPSTDPAGHGGNSGYLVVGGQEALNTTTFGLTIRTGYTTATNHVAWNPDGKRAAWVRMNRPNPDASVMVNGKPMGQTYQTINELRWSPDGLRLYFQGVSPTGTFPVIDGQELDGYHWIKDFQWSPDGKRYAFWAANSAGTWMVVDGKVQPKAYGFMDGSLRFSPDGKHVAYGAQTTVNAYQPVVDGALIPTTLETFGTRGQSSPPIFLPKFVYSPDGAHLAYAGRKDGTSPGVIFIDEVPHPAPQGSLYYPAWSPDSRHFAAVIGTGRGWLIMLDGKMSPTYEDMIQPNLGSSRFVDGHTYRFYAVKGTDIYRVTLDIGA